jgi:hypothetical protein
MHKIEFYKIEGKKIGDPSIDIIIHDVDGCDSFKRVFGPIGYESSDEKVAQAQHVDDAGRLSIGFDMWGEFDEESIDFCPFCGEKLEYKQIGIFEYARTMVEHRELVLKSKTP